MTTRKVRTAIQNTCPRRNIHQHVVTSATMAPFRDIHPFDLEFKTPLALLQRRGTVRMCLFVGAVGMCVYDSWDLSCERST